MNELVSEMAEAIKSRTALPRMPENLDLEAAYGLQKELVAAVAWLDDTDLRLAQLLSQFEEAFRG